MLAAVAEGGVGVIDRDRRATQRAGNHRPGRRRRRRWAGVLLVLTGLAAVLAVLLPRLVATPTAGPPDGRPDTATPSSSDQAALPAEVLLYVATTTVKGTPIWDIWVTNPDGTGRRNLTRDAANDTAPAWSPDGHRIVYASQPARCRGSGCQVDLYVIGRDGRNRARLTSTPQDELGPDWSPDGARIAYIRRDDDRPGVWVMAADGSGQRRISGIGPVRGARWSPDGSRIALTMRDAVWIINADGSGLRRVRQSAADPFWTPDGRHLVFTAYGSGTAPPELRRIDADGRNETALRP